MAKSIYVDQEGRDELMEKLREIVEHAKCYDTVNVKSVFKTDNRKVTVSFSEGAWLKIKALVEEFGTEVQWHGLVNRVSNDEFYIYDIIVPPHSVTGSTVTSEYKPYQDWLFGLDDDTFNCLKFHGHSHVNMGCSPSGVDMKYRHDLVTQLPPPNECVDGVDSFYIFLIVNKKGEWTGEVYDVANNALYNTGEITLKVYLSDGSLLNEFIASAKKQAVQETVNTVKPYNQPTVFSGFTHQPVKQESDTAPAARHAGSEYGGMGIYDDYYDRYWGD